ncbi:hypothetical protein F383_29138 [Gossypium arboreum]|uniref:Uncharacterized protein n=1 Tax=Gossypium arboreum TaxID=29729 RepID=A0A0B0PGJ2_GOSAR|nr:hypothetical protein F383_29138 [Gossypium arboreum]
MLRLLDDLLSQS